MKRLKLTRAFSKPWDAIAHAWEEADLILIEANHAQMSEAQVKKVKEKLKEMKGLLKTCLRELPQDAES